MKKEITNAQSKNFDKDDAIKEVNAAILEFENRKPRTKIHQVIDLFGVKKVENSGRSRLANKIKLLLSHEQYKEALKECEHLFEFDGSSWKDSTTKGIIIGLARLCTDSENAAAPAEELPKPIELATFSELGREKTFLTSDGAFTTPAISPSAGTAGENEEWIVLIETSLDERNFSIAGVMAENLPEDNHSKPLLLSRIFLNQLNTIGIEQYGDYYNDMQEQFDTWFPHESEEESEEECKEERTEEMELELLSDHKTLSDQQKYEINIRKINETLKNWLKQIQSVNQVPIIVTLP